MLPPMVEEISAAPKLPAPAVTLPIHADSRPGFSFNLNNGARAAAKLSRNPAGHDVQRTNRIQIRGSAGERIDAVHDGNSIDNVKHTIVHPAHMKEAIILGYHARRSRDYLPQLTASATPGSCSI